MRLPTISRDPAIHPCTLAHPKTTTNAAKAALRRHCRAILALPQLAENAVDKNHHQAGAVRHLEGLLHSSAVLRTAASQTNRPVCHLGERWKEYQGVGNWEGLLDPLDDNLRGEILRYGRFVDAAYKSFDFDPSSPTYATCRFPKSSLLSRAGLPRTGYRLTRDLRMTSGISLPGWLERAPGWVGTRSSWAGYVAVCQDKEEIARLGRRDVVIALRGTATCLEWLENLRVTLAPVPEAEAEGGCSEEKEKEKENENENEDPMVQTGFLSLYTSGSESCRSLREMVREEIGRVLESYGEEQEPLSLTVTGHSLGAALAILAAYDIRATFGSDAPLVTVVSFGGPRVGNRSFRRRLESDHGTKVLRIVNSDDLITKIPGFVVEEEEEEEEEKGSHAPPSPSWIRRRVEDTQWVYAEVGKELRLRSKDSPHLSGLINLATCHDLRTYLHLVNGFVSSTCRFKETASPCPCDEEGRKEAQGQFSEETAIFRR